MPASFREVPVEPSSVLHLFRDLDHLDAEVDEATTLGHELARRLGTNKVWMLSSTAIGGGVAEMLPRLGSLAEEMGIDVRWLVLDPGDPSFFPITKALHNQIHGKEGIADWKEAGAIYERVSREAAERLHLVTRGDILLVHDPQPAGIVRFLDPGLRTGAVWRCHVGTPERNVHTAAAWRFLEPYLESYPRVIFSSDSYVPAALRDRATVVPPGIDPLGHKNRILRPYKLVGVLRAAGLVDGPDVPEWARFDQRALRFHEGEWVERPIPHLLHVPLVLQVSRFDRLKGYDTLMRAFTRLVENCGERAKRVRARSERVEAELRRAQLLLAGPDPAGVSDDPEALEVLEELCAQHAALPEDMRARVHLLRLPMADVKENALMVNALQRIASVAVQNSRQEGFGLTVAEALWKGTPFVGARRGGIAIQVRHGKDGLLVDDPDDPEAIAEALLHMLACPLEAEAMARSGRRRVLDHFLSLIQLRRLLEEGLKLLDAAAQAGTRLGAPP